MQLTQLWKEQGEFEPGSAIRLKFIIVGFCLRYWSPWFYVIEAIDHVDYHCLLPISYTIYQHSYQNDYLYAIVSDV